MKGKFKGTVETDDGNRSKYMQGDIPVTVNPNKLERLLEGLRERLIQKLYYIQRREVTIITKRSGEEYEHAVSYKGDLAIPISTETVIQLQDAAELMLQNNPEKNEAGIQREVYVGRFDPFGILRRRIKMAERGL